MVISDVAMRDDFHLCKMYLGDFKKKVLFARIVIIINKNHAEDKCYFA